MCKIAVVAVKFDFNFVYGFGQGGLLLPQQATTTTAVQQQVQHDTIGLNIWRSQTLFGVKSKKIHKCDEIVVRS